MSKTKQKKKTYLGVNTRIPKSVAKDSELNMAIYSLYKSKNRFFVSAIKEFQHQIKQKGIEAAIKYMKKYIPPTK